MKRYLVRTYGCQMNEADSEIIAGLLDADGMEPADGLDTADVVVLNTCCIRENADNKLYGQLGHLKSLKDARPDVQIAVAGCLAQKDRSLIAQRAPHVDVVFGTHNVGRAAELLRHAQLHGPVTEIIEEADEFPSALPVRRELGYASWLTIQIGCDNSCAFCIVPAVRGKEISRPFGELVAQAEQLAAEGVTEVTLLGQNVNSYGRDLALSLRAGTPASSDASTDASSASALAGERWASGDRRARPLFGDLLRAVGSVDGIERVRFTSPHPKDLRPDVIAAMAQTPAVCEHLHLPVQSGSDQVLAAMHRGYTAQRYLERAAAARAAVDDLALTTDIIVGFPGETDADFTQTLELAAEVGYDSAFTFVFSPRPGTEAAQMRDQFVAPEVAAERMARLRTVIERSALANNRARIGRREEVVVEGRSKKDAAKLTGRTRQNRLVHFEAPEPLRAGTYALIDVTDAATFHLTGELAEVTAPARHRTRLEVVAA